MADDRTINSIDDSTLPIMKEIVQKYLNGTLWPSNRGETPGLDVRDDGHVYVCSVGVDGIPARDVDDILGHAACPIYRLLEDGTSDRKLDPILYPDDTNNVKEVFNPFDFLIPEGYHVCVPTKSGPWIVVPAGVAADGDTSTCGCCNPFTCIADDEATVGDCDACPNGAPPKYTFNAGTFSDQTQYGGIQEVTWDSGCTWLGPPMVYITRGNWAPLTFYNVDDTVRNGGRSYICITAGTSAASGGPSGTSTAIVDGSAEWDYSL